MRGDSLSGICIMNMSRFIKVEPGEKLEDALKQYEACDRKIRERGQSIVGAANKLIGYGVPKNPKKPLPPEIGMEEAE